MLKKGSRTLRACEKPEIYSTHNVPDTSFNGLLESEVDSWVNRFAQGLTNEDLSAGFLGSVEYFNSATKGKSDKANWILSAVLDELQRVPTTNELNTWESMLQ